MFNLGHIGILIDELLHFNIELYYADMCVYHQCSQTPAEICRNMGICCGFRAGC